MADGKTRYRISGNFDGREVLDAVLDDIKKLEDLPNDYRERSIHAVFHDSTNGREGVEYKILDGNNIRHTPGEKTCIDARGVRRFRVQEGKLVEVSKG